MKKLIAMERPSYIQRIKIAFQYVMPQFYLTHLMGWLAERKWGVITHFFIKIFAKIYHVNMDEAQKNKASDYQSFNQFFIRPLLETARPINDNPSALCLPADGKISALGDIITSQQLLEVKGHNFNLSGLVAEDSSLVDSFMNGVFAITYLSPRDYHRVHMPCDGVLRKMIYVPGELFSVNPFLVTHIPNLFSRNERVICVFDTDFGVMAQILVGATITASISTAWAGVVNPPRHNEIKAWEYNQSDIKLQKGEEMGAFRLGSTVINLFPANSVAFSEDLTLEQQVNMGGLLATMK